MSAGESRRDMSSIVRPIERLGGQTVTYRVRRRPRTKKLWSKFKGGKNVERSGAKVRRGHCSPPKKSGGLPVGQTIAAPKKMGFGPKGRKGQTSA